MAYGRPTTDTGTVVVHAIMLVSFVVLLLTGLRIASDDPTVTWLGVLDPVLPMEQVWYRHLVAAVVFVAALAGYAIYLIRARLTGRVRLDGARLRALLRPGNRRWAALNTAVYWGLMACLMIEIATGAMLFLDTGRVSLVVHLWATWAAIALVGLHVACHVAIGGVRQLARILRPAPLMVAPPPPDLAELLAEQLGRQMASDAPSTPRGAR
jgi:Prokaryotic cytochrome b561